MAVAAPYSMVLALLLALCSPLSIALELRPGGLLSTIKWVRTCTDTPKGAYTQTLNELRRAKAIESRFLRCLEEETGTDRALRAFSDPFVLLFLGDDNADKNSMINTLVGDNITASRKTEDVITFWTFDNGLQIIDAPRDLSMVKDHLAVANVVVYVITPDIQKADVDFVGEMLTINENIAIAVNRIHGKRYKLEQAAFSTPEEFHDYLRDVVTEPYATSNLSIITVDSEDACKAVGNHKGNLKDLETSSLYKKSQFQNIYDHIIAMMESEKRELKPCNERLQMAVMSSQNVYKSLQDTKTILTDLMRENEQILNQARELGEEIIAMKVDTEQYVDSIMTILEDPMADARQAFHDAHASITAPISHHAQSNIKKIENMFVKESSRLGGIDESKCKKFYAEEIRDIIATTIPFDIYTDALVVDENPRVQATFHKLRREKQKITKKINDIHASHDTMMNYLSLGIPAMLFSGVGFSLASPHAFASSTSWPCAASLGFSGLTAIYGTYRYTFANPHTEQERLEIKFRENARNMILSELRRFALNHRNRLGDIILETVASYATSVEKKLIPSYEEQ